MLTLLIIGSLIALAGAGVAVWRRSAPGRALPAVERGAPGVFTLRAGDVVQHLGTDYIIESTLDYQEDGATWKAHLLSGGDRERWLVVEEDDQVVIVLCEEIDDLEIAAGDPPRTLTYRGAAFAQRESGRATATRTSVATGGAQQLACRYWDYAGPDGQVLYVEDWPGEREISYGRRVSAAALTILPGT